jgi:Bifunctional DNA primase/polymerase, N-terminal
MPDDKKGRPGEEAASHKISDTGTSPVVSVALGYAARGWPVFPCTPDGTPAPDHKAPLTPRGFLDATTDPAQIAAWWRRWPQANVAIATGAPGPDVLDVDNHATGNGFEAFGRLKRAGMLTGAGSLVGTRSGGLHAYYAGTGQACGRLPAHHLDFKAAGRYVIAPPSVVLGRPYELLGHRPATGRLDWAAARALLDPPRPAAARPAGKSGTGLAAWVAGQQEGNRNGALFWAACRAAETGDAAALDHISAAAITAGLPAAEVRRTIASAERRAGA